MSRTMCWLPFKCLNTELWIKTHTQPKLLSLFNLTPNAPPQVYTRSSNLGCGFIEMSMLICSLYSFLFGRELWNKNYQMHPKHKHTHSRCIGAYIHHSNIHKGGHLMRLVCALSNSHLLRSDKSSSLYQHTLADKKHTHKESENHKVRVLCVSSPISAELMTMSLAHLEHYLLSVLMISLALSHTHSCSSIFSIISPYERDILPQAI